MPDFLMPDLDRVAILFLYSSTNTYNGIKTITVTWELRKSAISHPKSDIRYLTSYISHPTSYIKHFCYCYR